MAYLAHSDSRQDHHWAIGASLRPPQKTEGNLDGTHIPPGWRGIDADVQSADIGIHAAWRRQPAVCSGDVSSTWQQSTMGMSLKKTNANITYKNVILYFSSQFILGFCPPLVPEENFCDNYNRQLSAPETVSTVLMGELRCANFVRLTGVCVAYQVINSCSQGQPTCS